MCTEDKFGKDVSQSYRELEGNETESREWFEDVVMGAQKKCKDADGTTTDAEVWGICEKVWGICEKV